MMGRVINQPIVSHNYTTPSMLLFMKLTDAGMTQAELARRSGLSKKHINDIYRGKARITPDTALKFEMIFGNDAAEWNKAQSYYDYDPTIEKNYAMKLIRKTHPLEVTYRYDDKKRVDRVQMQIFYRTIFTARRLPKNKYVIATLPTYYMANGVIVKNINQVNQHMERFIKWLGGILTVHTLEVIRDFDDGKVSYPDDADDSNQSGSESNSDM